MMTNTTMTQLLARTWRRLWPALALACLLPIPGAAAPPTCGQPPCGTATSCDTALALTQVQPMNFGSVVPTAAGSVTLGVDGSRIGSGGLVVLTSAATAGSFLLDTGVKNCSSFPLVSISVAAPVTLTHLTQPANTMSLSGFVTSPAAGVLYSPNQVINVGATLSVAGGQPAGDYAGTYLLTVTFQ